MATTIFCKKVQKNSPNGTIFGKILVRRRPGFLLDRKKIEKSSKFSGHFGFFLEDTYTRAEKGINNISHAGKEKMGKMEKKSDHFRIFVEDTWLERSDGNFNNNAQRAERKKIYDNRHIRFTTKKQSIHYKNKERKTKK